LTPLVKGGATILRKKHNVFAFCVEFAVFCAWMLRSDEKILRNQGFFIVSRGQKIRKFEFEH